MANEAPEGVVLYSAETGVIDYTDVLGQYAKGKGKYKDTELVVLSKNQIESVDLLSEGPIEGLVSGIWNLSGTIGLIGYTGGTFTPYIVPTGYTGIQFFRSIYWNEIPILDDQGRFNFQSVVVSGSIGTQDGQVMQTLSPFQKTSRTIGERLRKGFAKTYRILNRDCRGCTVNVKIPQLSQTKLSNGDLMRTKVEYTISYRALFSNQLNADFTLAKNEVVFGKIQAAGGYVRTTRIDFPTNFYTNSNFIGWEIRVERTTDESSSALLSNASYVDSITEIQGDVYTYPNSAIVRALFDAEFFTSVPDRAFDTKLLKVKIPGNYDPIYKTYSTTGFATTNSGWDGTFATGKAWTDNPAWCFYDLLTNRRYGLGKYVDPSFIDKFTLYDIGKYCDTLVSDGVGGVEPRFSCNVWIASKEDAYKVISDMASIFRGITYYANSQIYAVQDSPKDPITSFTNANVENGDFNYSTTSKKNRHSVAICRYNDPLNLYKPAVEYVEDIDSIRKYGIREIDLTCFGCTSRAQAIRQGRALLLGENTETESIFFTAGMEGTFLRPGDVFKVYDANRKLKRYGGRIYSFTGPTGAPYVTLDSAINLETNVGYVLSVVTPSYVYDSSQVSGLNSSDSSNIRKNFIQKFSFSGWQAGIDPNGRTSIGLTSGFDSTNYNISGNPVWVIELDSAYSTYTGIRYLINPNFDYYKVVNIIEKDGYKYDVVGLQYNPGKFNQIESGLSLQRDLISASKVPVTPRSLTLNVFDRPNNTQVITYSFLVDDYSNINSYKVYAKVDPYVDNNVPSVTYQIANLPYDKTSDSFVPGNSGTYYFRVYSSNDLDGILSPNFATGAALVTDINQIQGVIISTLTVDSYSGTYSGDVRSSNVTVITDNDANPNFTWQIGFQNNTALSTAIQYRITIRQIDDAGSRIPTDNVYLEVTGITTNSYQFNLDTNIGLDSGPFRSYQVVVEAHDAIGNTSAGNQCGVFPENGWNAHLYGYDIVDFNNPRFTGAELSYNLPTLNYLGGDTATGTSGLYKTISSVGPNGEINIRFTQGQFDSDLAGGYLYTYTGQFPKLEATIASTPIGASVQRTQFTFDPNNPLIYSPIGALNFKGLSNIYASVSFFDSIDQALIVKGQDVGSQLYVSNNALIFNYPSVGSTLFANTSGAAVVNSITVTGYIPSSDSNATYVKNLIPAGATVIGIASTSTSAVPSTLTTILYMGIPSSISGISAPAPSTVSSGFLGAMSVIMSDGTTKPISSVVVGDQIESRTITNFNTSSDNWKTWTVSNLSNQGVFWEGGSPLRMQVSTGNVTAISCCQTVPMYLMINTGLTLTPEEPLLYSRKSNSTTYILAASTLATGDRLWCRVLSTFPNYNRLLSPITVGTIETVVVSSTVYNLQTTTRLFFISGSGNSETGHHLVHDGVYSSAQTTTTTGGGANIIDPQGGWGGWGSRLLPN